MDYTVLKNEIDTDPLARGYAGMTDSEVATDLNTEYRTFNRTSITGEDLARLSDGSELSNLVGRQFALWQTYCGLEVISIETGTETREALAALFPAGSDTRAQIVAFIQENISISRAAELGLEEVASRHVRDVR